MSLPSEREGSIGLDIIKSKVVYGLTEFVSLSLVSCTLSAGNTETRYRLSVTSLRMLGRAIRRHGIIHADMTLLSTLKPATLVATRITEFETSTYGSLP